MLAFYRMFLLKRLRDFIFSRQSDILSAAVVLGASTLASMFLGLIRDRSLAQFFTPDQIAIYFGAFRIPETFFEILIFSSLSSAFIPTFISYIAVKKEKEAWHIASTLINLALWAFTCLALLIAAFAKPISALIAPGFSPSDVILMAQLTRILLLAQAFFVVSFFLTGVLKSFQHFLIPAIAPIFYNLGIIGATIFLSGRLGIYAPAIGAVIGAFLHFLVQVPLARQLGFRPHLSFETNHPGVQKVIKLALPRFVELIFIQILKASDLFFSSLINTAAYSYLTFATHLEMVPVSLFGFSLADAALPTLAYKKDNPKEFSKVFFAVFRQIVFFALPIAAAFIVLRIPLTRLAFGSDRFTWEATILTAYTLSFFAVGIIGQVLTFYFVRAFYAFQDTATPVKVAIVNIILDIALGAYFIMVLKLPVWALGLSSSLTNLTQAFALFLILSKRRKLPVWEFIAPTFKVAIAALGSASVMYVILKVLDRSAWDPQVSFLGRFALPAEWPSFILDTRYTVNLIILTFEVLLVGALVYLLLCRILKVGELQVLPQIWRRIISPRRVKVLPTVQNGRE